jgi:hypothetical protein
MAYKGDAPEAERIEHCPDILDKLLERVPTRRMVGFGVPPPCDRDGSVAIGKARREVVKDMSARSQPREKNERFARTTEIQIVYTQPVTSDESLPVRCGVRPNGVGRSDGVSGIGTCLVDPCGLGAGTECQHRYQEELRDHIQMKHQAWHKDGWSRRKRAALWQKMSRFCSAERKSADSIASMEYRMMEGHTA